MSIGALLERIRSFVGKYYEFHLVWLYYMSRRVQTNFLSSAFDNQPIYLPSETLLLERLH